MGPPRGGAGEDDEDEEDAEASSGYGKEVDGDQVSDVVGEERPPGLRGLRAPLRHEAGDGALRDADAELQELSVDAGSTPQRIRLGHFHDESGVLGIEGGGGSAWPPGVMGPAL